MTEELQKLVVRLIGDDSSFRKMATSSVGIAREMTLGITGAFKSIGLAATGLTAIVSLPFLGLFGIFKLVTAGINLLTTTVQLVLAPFKLVARAVVGIFTAAYEGVTGLIKAIAGGIGTVVGMVRNLASTAVSMAAQAEQIQLTFEVMLGGAEKAKKMLGELRAFSDKSPFDMLAPQEAAKLLLNFGVEGNKVVDIVKKLGDVAVGDRNKLMSFSLVFGQMSAAGKLMGQDLLQFVNAGFNPLQEMSRTTGKSMAVLRAEMSAGRITTKMVEDAFISATKEGGRFHNMTERQAETLTGLKSTLKDVTDTALRNFGSIIGNIFDLRGITKQATAFVEHITKAMEQLANHPMIEQARETFSKVFVAIQDMAGEAFDWIVAKVSFSGGDIESTLRDILIVTEFVADNWKVVLSQAVDEVHLKFVTWFEDIKHFFRQGLPSLMQEFVTTFKAMGATLAEGASMIGDILKAELLTFGKFNTEGMIQTFVKGMELDLRRGLQGVGRALGDIPVRQKTELETQLQASVTVGRDKIGGDITSFLAKRRAELATVAPGVSGDPEKPGITTPQTVATNPQRSIDFGLSSEQTNALKLQANANTPQQKALKEAEKTNTKLDEANANLKQLVAGSRKSEDTLQPVAV